MNKNNPAVRRIMADRRELDHNPSPRYSAAPLDDNLFEWHFTIRGPKGSDFDGGLYHGRILLPSDYPHKPPHFMFLNHNGRFEVGTKICLSISGHHEETWQPAWGIRTMLEAIISFLPTPGEGAIGALDWSKKERHKLANESLLFKCTACGVLTELIDAEIDDTETGTGTRTGDVKVGGSGSAGGATGIATQKDGPLRIESSPARLGNASLTSAVHTPPNQAKAAPANPNPQFKVVVANATATGTSAALAHASGAKAPSSPQRSPLSLSLRLDTSVDEGQEEREKNAGRNLPLTPAPPMRTGSHVDGQEQPRVGTSTFSSPASVRTASAVSSPAGNVSTSAAASPSSQIEKAGSKMAAVQLSGETIQRVRSISESYQHPTVAAAIAAADSRDHSEEGATSSVAVAASADNSPDMPEVVDMSRQRDGEVPVATPILADVAREPPFVGDTEHMERERVGDIARDVVHAQHEQDMHDAGLLQLPPVFPKEGAHDSLDVILYTTLAVLLIYMGILFTCMLVTFVDEGESEIL